MIMLPASQAEVDALIAVEEAVGVSAVGDTPESEPIDLDQQQNLTSTTAVSDTSAVIGDCDDVDNTTKNFLDGEENEVDGQEQGESNSNAANTVVIDISNPIQLSQNSLIVVNGQKCVLQQNADTGQLLAYPIKEPDKPKKKRGRPRKLKPDPEAETNVPLPEEEGHDGSLNNNFVKEQYDEELVEEPHEKGLVEKPNEAGEIVKRSARKRKLARTLTDYETGGLDLECSSEEGGEGEDDDDDDEPVPKKRSGRGRGRPRKVAAFGNNAPNSQFMQFLNPAKRGRGRPRRYGIKPENNQTQAFLIQLADGQTVMMQVPMANIPPGMSAQSIAQSIAESLQAQQQKLPVAIAPKPEPAEGAAGDDATADSSSLVEIVSSENGIVVIEKDDKKDGVADETTEALSSIDSSLGEALKEPTATSESLAEDSSNPVDLDENGAPTQGARVVTNNATVIPLPPSVMPILMNKQETPIKIGLKATENDLEKLRCPKCEFQAYYHQQYQDHLTLHLDDVLRCKCCSYLALEDDELVMHYKENHPKCICSVCNHTAEHAYIIKRHMYRHSDTGCACEICGKTYKDHYILKMHMKMVHMPAEVLFECPVCAKKFTRKAHLKRHLRTHDPDKPYKCPLCDYRGCEKSDITKHMLIHEDPKHTCEVCGKTFRHIKNKELHVKRHKGQRDYKCGVCDFYGYTFTDIRKHIERKHSDAKTIICDRCGQAFKTEGLMKEHQGSGQCELFMLDQAFNEAETSSSGAHLDNVMEAADLHDASGITTITLPDGSLATLDDLAASGQIVLSDGKIHIPNSQLVDSSGQLAIVTNQDGTTQVAMVTEQGELSTTGFTLVAEDGEGNDHVTMVTQEMLSGVVESAENPQIVMETRIPVVDDDDEDEEDFSGEEDDTPEET